MHKVILLPCGKYQKQIIISSSNYILLNKNEITE